MLYIYYFFIRLVMTPKDFISAIKRLQKIYKIKIRRGKPFEILVHGILSTRTKDETTFPAQERLLRMADSPYKLSLLTRKQIEKAIFPVGFYKTKARMLKKTATELLEEFNGKVPGTKDDLLKLPGVGPKVASLVLVWGFGLPYIPVDTHVNRVSKRLGIVPKDSKPEETQQVIETILSDREKLIANHLLVTFGKDICKPISPLCYRCPVYDLCEYKEKEYYRAKGKNKPKHLF